MPPHPTHLLRILPRQNKLSVSKSAFLQRVSISSLSPTDRLHPQTSLRRTARYLATMSTPSASSKPQIRISFNSDAEEVSISVAALTAVGGSEGRWNLTAQRNGVEREFKFKTFKKTWAFMDAVAAQCAVQKHHPEWSNIYNTTFIRWTTHSPPGLSSKDVQMAQYCDEKAAEFGEVVETKSESAKEDEAGDGVSKTDEGKGVLDELTGRLDGSCCVPKN